MGSRVYRQEEPPWWQDKAGHHQPHVTVGKLRPTGDTSRPGIEDAPRMGISRDTSRKWSRGRIWLSHTVMQMTYKSSPLPPTGLALS